VPQELTFDLQIERGYVVTAKIADEQLIEVWSPKSAVCRLTQKQVLGVLAQKLHIPL